MHRVVLACSLFLAAGCGTPSFLVTPVSSSTRLEEHEVQSGRGWSPGKVAIIEVEGMLMNLRSGGFLQPQENKVSLFAQEMERAAADPAVKAVVLRVNSPGGTVTASDTMYEMVQDFRQKTGKPVIASTQEVCASGAYYVCCAADKIVAHPTSVVGSIGVIFNTMDFQGAMSKLGIRAEAVKSGSLKDMGSPYKALQQDERAVMQGMVDEYFARFVSVVRGHRPVLEQPPAGEAAADQGPAAAEGRATAETLRAYREPGYAGVFSGRVFTGDKAVELGLADQAGRLEDAIDLARRMAKAPRAKVVMYKRPYGYTGSIYASNPAPLPRANVLHLELPGSRYFLGSGFFYLWEPALGQ